LLANLEASNLDPPLDNALDTKLSIIKIKVIPNKMNYKKKDNDKWQ
jgi:hypothetical protein